MAISLTLNGQPARSASAASTPLLYVLRNELDQSNCFEVLFRGALAVKKTAARSRTTPPP